MATTKTTPAPASLNNVNAAAMRAFVDTIQKDPKEAKKRKGVTGNWVFDAGQPQFVSVVEYAKGKVELKTELPAFAGGWGTSPDPIQYCLHGLAACFAVTFAATAAGEGVPLTRLSVTAENAMDLRKQMGLSTDPIIERVRFTVDCAGPDRATQQRLLKLTEERCPGAECVTRSIPLEVVLA